MWPNLWGPGWWWGALASFGFICSTVAWMTRVGSASRKAVGRRDELQELWKRYEQGDLTRREFQRLRRSWLERDDATRPGRASPAVPPAPGISPVPEPPGSRQGVR